MHPEKTMCEVFPLSIQTIFKGKTSVNDDDEEDVEDDDDDKIGDDDYIDNHDNDDNSGIS